MTLFDGTTMFNASYTHGNIEVHQSVIDELNGWIFPGSAKVKKFTEYLIRRSIAFCEGCTGNLNELTEPERLRSLAVLNAFEKTLPPGSKGSGTSRTDKELLNLARKNKAKLATQELTLRSLAPRSIPQEHLLSFEDLVADLFIQKVMSTEQILAGIKTLEDFKENLRQEGRKMLYDLLGVGRATGVPHE